MFKSRKQYFRNLIVTLALVLGLVMPTSTHPAQAQGNPNPGVIPNNTQYRTLSAKWWQWVISIPAATNPLLDATGANCAQGQSGPVWFLAGSTGDTVTRTCTVPIGKQLFFPLLNIIFGSGVFDCDPTNPGVPCDVDTLRAGAAGAMDNLLLLEARVDGRELQNLSAYRAQSPVFSITVPPDPIFGLPLTGTFTPQVSDGYWLMLAPLPPGNHTIHFKATASFGFTVEVTYNLTITP